jgi:hypothetical protein
VEFSTIWTRIDREAVIRVAAVKKAPRNVGGLPVIGEETESTVENTTHAEFHLQLGSLFRSAIANQKFQPSGSAIQKAIKRDVLFLMQLKEAEFEIQYNLPIDFEVELLRYGLVERQAIPPQSSADRLVSMIGAKFRVVFTSKFDRFLFWIEHNFGQWDSLNLVVRPREPIAD